MNVVHLARQVFPFSVIVAILLIYIRLYRKPGSLLLSFLLLFAVASGTWFLGIGYLARKTDKVTVFQENPFFPETIHRLESVDIYVFETEPGAVIKPVISSHRMPEAGPPHLNPLPVLEIDFDENGLFSPGDDQKIAYSLQNPVLSPVLRLSWFFDFLITRGGTVEKNFYSLYGTEKTEYFLLSFAVLGFFVFGSISVRLGSTPLFLVFAVIVLFVLFFVLNHQFSRGTASEVVRTLFPDREISPPVFAFGYFTLLFFLLNINYGLKRRRRARE